jgi:hypothetical protein
MSKPARRMIGSANAQGLKTKPTQLPTTKPGTNTSFGPLKQIDAGLLNVGYAEAGPADGLGPKWNEGVYR